jgi:hypothetical protein
MVSFMIFDYPSTYNTIIGWTTLNKIKAVTSTYHLKMKFPMKQIMGEVTSRRCYMASLKDPNVKETLTVEEVEIRDEGAKQVENLVEIPLNEEEPNRTAYLSSLLAEDQSPD